MFEEFIASLTEKQGALHARERQLRTELEEIVRERRAIDGAIRLLRMEPAQPKAKAPVRRVPGGPSEKNVQKVLGAVREGYDTAVRIREATRLSDPTIQRSLLTLRADELIRIAGQTARGGRIYRPMEVNGG